MTALGQGRLSSSVENTAGLEPRVSPIELSSSAAPAALIRRLLARSSHAAALPQWVPPQLTQLVDTAPEGDQWLHEIKFDGYRLHARLDRGDVRLLTRTGLDWTHNTRRSPRPWHRSAPRRPISTASYAAYAPTA